MGTTTQCTSCGCGSYHPVGTICDKITHIVVKKEATAGCCGHQREHHDHETHAECNGAGADDDEPSPVHGDGCGHTHAESRNHEHAHDTACGHEHEAPEALDYAALGEASATRAIYRIANMDCPMEENLIRKKLGSTPGITGLEFNLIQRVLTVSHNLPNTKPIEDALKAIDMTPEAVVPHQEAVALFSITEMDCPTEEGLIKSKLNGMADVLGLEFNLMQRTLKVRHRPEALPAISEALATLNLGAKLMEADDAKESAVPATKIPWKRLIAACIFAGFSEMFELIYEWKATPFGIDLHAFQIGGITVIEYLPMVLAIIAILLAGLATYKKGWIAVKNLNLNINALMAVAVTGAVIIGQYPEAAMVMVLFNIAEAIEAKSLDRARNAIKNLLSLTPEKATMQRPDGSWLEMDIRQVPVGSLVRVKPGERVALDGIITQGRSAINQAPITGESMPVEKTVDDNVFAGTINQSGSFEFKVTAAATNSTLARIIHAVEEAQGSRAPMQSFVDQFARIYTPAVFLTAILVAVIPPLLMGGVWTEWIYSALVILVIGCPCALVISTPVSIVSGMAAATKHGILIKGGMYLEQGRKLKWLALDKTGTITRGKPQQTDFLQISDMGRDRATALAASIAVRSDHPVSRAIAENATENGVVMLDVDDFAAIAGQGVSGVIGGKKWSLGNHRMVENLQLCSEWLENKIFPLEKQGKSVVALVGEEGVQALFAVADTLKDTSIEAIKELKQLGIKTIMLTGDNKHTAAAIASQVGVDEFKGELLPQDKQRTVELLARDGRVGMVGDGINDAPALAQAHIGFAMAAAGTDTAIETADVALMDDDLRKIPRFIRLSRSTYAILVQNITLALAVKAVFFALTFMGMATMWMAVFADVGTSLLVVANGLRAMRK